MVYCDCLLSLYRQYEFEDRGGTLFLCECHSAALSSAVHLYGDNSYVRRRISCAQCLLCVRSSCQCVVLKCHLALPPTPRSFTLCRFRVTHELEIRLFLHCIGKLLCIVLLFSQVPVLCLHILDSFLSAGSLRLFFCPGFIPLQLILITEQSGKIVSCSICSFICYILCFLSDIFYFIYCTLDVISQLLFSRSGQILSVLPSPACNA